jgi:hypothetical protein
LSFNSNESPPRGSRALRRPSRLLHELLIHTIDRSLPRLSSQEPGWLATHLRAAEGDGYRRWRPEEPRAPTAHCVPITKDTEARAVVHPRRPVRWSREAFHSQSGQPSPSVRGRRRFCSEHQPMRCRTIKSPRPRGHARTVRSKYRMMRHNPIRLARVRPVAVGVHESFDHRIALEWHCVLPPHSRCPSCRTMQQGPEQLRCNAIS